MSDATPAAAPAAEPRAPMNRRTPSPGQVYLSLSQASQRYPVHQKTLYRWMQTRGYPRPVQFSSSCARIPLAEIEAWEAEQEQARG